MGKAEYKGLAKPGAGAKTRLVPAEETLTVPKASSYAAPTNGGSPPKKLKVAQKNPNAPAYLCVSKVSSEALYFTDDSELPIFPGDFAAGRPVYLVTLSHPGAFPSCAYKLTDSIDTMLQQEDAEEAPDRPKNWGQLAERLHFIEITTGTYAPYNLPYQNWQRAYYGLDAKNFCMEIDSMIVYLKQNRTALPKFGDFPLKVQIARGVDFTLSKKDFDYPFTNVHVGVETLAITPLNVYPPVGVRPLVAHVELVGESGIAMTFYGDTYRHRKAFRDNGLEMERESMSEDGNDSNMNSPKKRQECFHIMTTKDITNAEDAETVKNLVTEAIAHVIVDFRVLASPVPDCAGAKFLQSLQEHPNLMVRSI